MSGSNYSIAYEGDCATLSACIRGKYIPLISSEDRLKVKGIYHNILTGTYKSARELCEDIHNNFSLQATMLVLVTLQSTEAINNKYRKSKTEQVRSMT